MSEAFGIPLTRLIEGVLAGDRALLGRAITLAESRREDHQRLAQDLLTAVLPHTGHARRCRQMADVALD